MLMLARGFVEITEPSLMWKFKRREPACLPAYLPQRRPSITVLSSCITVLSPQDLRIRDFWVGFATGHDLEATEASKKIRYGAHPAAAVIGSTQPASAQIPNSFCNPSGGKNVVSQAMGDVI